MHMPWLARGTEIARTRAAQAKGVNGVTSGQPAWHLSRPATVWRCLALTSACGWGLGDDVGLESDSS